jgi:hypothetical protein
MVGAMTGKGAPGRALLSGEGGKVSVMDAISVPWEDSAETWANP